MQALVRTLLTTGFLLSIAAQGHAGENGSKIGEKIPEFKLQDFRGTEHSLAEWKDKTIVVVAFLGTECPLAKLYATRLDSMDKELSAQGVQVLAVMSNQQDNITEIAHFARTQKLEFPVLKDTGNTVADLFGAKRTPEVFVLDKDRVVRYRGRIDDQYGIGYSKSKPEKTELRDAITAVLEGKEVAKTETNPPGCIIGRIRTPSADSPVTYSKEIARIFQNRCVECHRPGQIAPFALTSYDEVAGWAEMILEVVDAQRMPPWHANPAHGKFANDARLTDEQIHQIRTWVEHGAPEGNPDDLPEPVQYAEGWRIPKPDLILTMENEFTVPAEGEVSYQYITLDPGLTEDKWIKGAECLAGNPAVVHHIIAFILPPSSSSGPRDGDRRADRPDDERRRERGEGDRGDRRGDRGFGDRRGGPGGPGGFRGGDRFRGGQRGGEERMRAFFNNFLVATAPGAPPMMLPDGMAKKIEAGSKIVFQLHYTPNGKEQTDKSSIGLVFADPKTVTREVVTRAAMERFFEIPPHANNHLVEASLRFRDDTLMLEFLPHMHLRGKSFRYTAHYPDGKSEILLDIPGYDFNWQNTYTLAEPKLLPRGTVLHCVAHFDNSEENLANPNADETVTWGDQTWEEMMIGFFNMARANQDVQSDKEIARMQQFASILSKGPLVVDSKTAELAKHALDSDQSFAALWDVLIEKLPQLDRMDLTSANGFKLSIDRVVQTDELPNVLAMKKFPRNLDSLGPALGLYQYAIGKKLVINHNMSEAKGMEMQLLGRLLPSAVHAPVRIEGRFGTVNFWSLERDAFPPEAVTYIEQLVDLMKTSEAQANAK